MRLVLTSLAALFTIIAFSASAWAADVVDPKPFDQLLGKYVDKKGNVDYAGLKANAEDRKSLDTFVAKIGSTKVTGSKKAQLAFYINAYNAIVIKSVVDKYPISSVMKVDGFFKKEKHTVGGKEMTLDHLEHKLIRPKFNEARIHFVLVCAAKSCPRLQQRAATHANLSDMLESAAKEFIPGATSVKGETIETSKLFEWFAEDFEKSAGSVKKYLAKYVPDHADVILSKDSKLTFSHYSWKLNKQ